MLLQAKFLSEKPVDILLATYNGGKYLTDQLDSILRQTHSNWHIIVRDDGSTDGTMDILNAYACAHPGKIDIIHDDKGRLYPALNFAALMEKSKADYVMFSDQDDIWYPNKIDKTLSAMHELEEEKSKTAPLIVYTDAHLIHKNGESQGLHLRHKMQTPAISLRTQLVDNMVWGCTAMINKPLLELAVPLPKTCGHDGWCGALAMAVGGAKCIEEPTLFHRRHDQNASCHGREKGGVGNRLDGILGSMQTYVVQAQELQGRIEERLGASAVPKELHQFMDIMHAPAWQRPARLLAEGFSNPKKWPSNLLRAIGTIRTESNGRG